jgi:hypothetical protein
MASQNEAPQVAYLLGIATGRLDMISPAKNVIENNQAALVRRVLQKVGKLLCGVVWFWHGIREANHLDFIKSGSLAMLAAMRRAYPFPSK